MHNDKPHPSHYLMIGVLAAVGILFIAAMVISINGRDNMTSWATIKSRELHAFMEDCKSNGGSVDVRPNESPKIIFVCEYSDRTVEYTLQPGK